MTKMKLLLFPLLLLVTLFSCNKGPDLKNQDIRDHEMSLVNISSFEKSDLSRMELKIVLDRKMGHQSSFLIGDLIGDSLNEILLIDKNSLSVYSLDGELIQSKVFEGKNFGNGILADIDEDSKLDILLGAKEEKSVMISAYNGKLEKAFEFTHSKLYNGETKLHFYHDNHLYFTTSSTLAIPPKISGALNTTSEELSWEYFTGPVADDLSANKDFSLLTISNTPKSANGLVLDDRTVSDHSKHQPFVYLLDNVGNMIYKEPVGPEYNVGVYTESGISSMVHRLFDFNGDGETEIISAVNRVSEFYIGNSVLEVRSSDGELLQSREFLNNTELDFSFYRVSKGMEIALLENHQRKFSLLDRNLEIINTWQFPEDTGIGIFHECGDFNGDGKIEYLLSNENRIYVLDHKLNVIFSSALNQSIKSASFSVDGDGLPRLYVHGDSLNIFALGEGPVSTLSIYTRPPGATILYDGSKVPESPIGGVLNNVSPGKIILQATMNGKSSVEVSLDLLEGIHHQVILEIEDRENEEIIKNNQRFRIESAPEPQIPLNDWNDIFLENTYSKNANESIYYWVYDDFAGDEAKDFLFYDSEFQLYSVYDDQFNLLTKFKIPLGTQIANISGSHPDVNGDSKADLVIFDNERTEFSLYSAAGQLLQKKTIGLFPNSKINGAFQKDGLFYFLAGSGYTQQPRGIYSIDLEKADLSFFYPIASQPTGLLLTEDEKLLIPHHTLSNGGTVIYDDGKIARDTEYFIHIADKDGNQLAQSYNPDFEENNGTLTYYSMDINGDGNEEVYMFANKSDYYTGSSKIFELDTETGDLSEPLLETGTNTTITLMGKLYNNGEPLLSLFIRKPWGYFWLNENFEIVKTFTEKELGTPDYQNYMYPDLNGDGNSEILAWNKMGLTIYDLDFNVLYRVDRDFMTNELKRVILEDIDLDGKYEILLFTNTDISVYSY